MQQLLKHLSDSVKLEYFSETPCGTCSCTSCPGPATRQKHTPHPSFPVLLDCTEGRRAHTPSGHGHHPTNQPGWGGFAWPCLLHFGEEMKHSHIVRDDLCPTTPIGLHTMKMFQLGGLAIQLTSTDRESNNLTLARKINTFISICAKSEVTITKRF